MKKSTIFILKLSVVIILIITLLFLFNKNHIENENENQYNTEISFTDSANTVFYYEGDENLDFNYIINPNELDEYKNLIPLIGITKMGSVINDYLTDSNYKGKLLTITKTDLSPPCILITLSISDSKDILNINYNYFENDYRMFLTVNE